LWSFSWKLLSKEPSRRIVLALPASEFGQYTIRVLVFFVLGDCVIGVRCFSRSCSESGAGSSRITEADKL